MVPGPAPESARGDKPPAALRTARTADHQGRPRTGHRRNGPGVAIQEGPALTIVVDTNVMIAALIQAGIVRELILCQRDMTRVRHTGSSWRTTATRRLELKRGLMKT